MSIERPSSTFIIFVRSVGRAMTDLKVLFSPTSTEAFSDKAMTEQALGCIDAFTQAFNRRDLQGMDALLHFPHVILSAEKLLIWDAPGALPVTFFDDLARDTGWTHTAYREKLPVLVSPRKVHLVVDYSRNRADGSVITHHRNLWIVTHESGRWGIKQRSY